MAHVRGGWSVPGEDTGLRPKIPTTGSGAQIPQDYQNGFKDGWNWGLEKACRRLETANDETSLICLIQAIRDMKEK